MIPLFIAVMVLASIPFGYVWATTGRWLAFWAASLIWAVMCVTVGVLT